MGTAGKALRKMGKGNTSGTYFIGQERDEKSLKEFERGTRFNESVHVSQILLCASMLGKYLSEENYFCAVLWGGTLALNTSLIMLQRYNRARVYDVLDRRKKRKSKK